MEETKIPTKKILLIFLLLGIIASYSIFYSTHWGPWVFSDSTAYIGAAKNLIAGNGLGNFTPSGRFEYVGGHPPLYHLTLALFGSIGLDILSAARWMNIVLFGLLILSLGLSIYLLSNSLVLSALISACVLASPILLDVFSGVMTEPQFLFLGVLGLLLLLFYIRSNNRLLIFSSAIAAGLSLLGRYPGLAFILAGTLFIFSFSEKDLQKRIKDVAYYLSISVAPTIIWLLWAYTRPSATPHRGFSFPVSGFWNELAPLRVDMVNVLWGWVPFSTYMSGISYRLRLFLLSLVVLCMTALLILALKKIKMQGQDWRSNKSLPIVGIFSFLFIAFFLVIALFFTFLTLKPGLIDRTLIPLQVSGIIVIFSFINFIGEVWSIQKYTIAISLLLGVLILSLFIPHSLEIVSRYHAGGSGYTSERWRSSGTIAALEQVSPDTPIITNDPDVILFFLERPAYEIDWSSFDPSEEDLHRYGDDTADPIERVFREEGAALVLFDGLYWQLEPFYGEKTQQRIDSLVAGLKPYASSWDGDIYFYDHVEP